MSKYSQRPIQLGRAYALMTCFLTHLLGDASYVLKKPNSVTSKLYSGVLRLPIKISRLRSSIMVSESNKCELLSLCTSARMTYWVKHRRAICSRLRVNVQRRNYVDLSLIPVLNKPDKTGNIVLSIIVQCETS